MIRTKLQIEGYGSDKIRNRTIGFGLKQKQQDTSWSKLEIKGYDLG